LSFLSKILGKPTIDDLVNAIPSNDFEKRSQGGFSEFSVIVQDEIENKGFIMRKFNFIIFASQSFMCGQ
jgi:hypothetical protein